MTVGIYFPKCGWAIDDIKQMEGYEAIDQVDATGFDKKIVLDLLYSDESIEARLELYNLHFDRILFFLQDYAGNTYLNNNIIQQCKKIDLSKVELIITGVVDYVPCNMKITRYEEFFMRVSELYNELNYAPLTHLAPYTSKPYYFDALLGVNRPHRTWIQSQVNKYCTDKILLKYYQNPSLSAEKLDFDWPSGASITDTSTWGVGFFTANTVDYHGVATWLSFIVPIEIYNQSAYSIVAETATINDYNFYTEKIIKPILAKRLFICFSSVNYLKNLRSLGFKTFDNVIDESYDQEVNPDIRFQKAFDQVLYLCNQEQTIILDQIKEITEHNYNLLVSKDWRREWKDSIDLCLAFK
jgi:hypothetical protein